MLSTVAARCMPDIRFVIVGSGTEPYRRYASENVSFVGLQVGEELVRWMQRSKVYVQVSAHEGFGHALAQAMLCNCIPVVVERGAIPEVVGNEGVYARYGDVSSTVDSIRLAMHLKLNPRERIIREFSLAKRRHALLEQVADLTRNLH